MELLFKCVRVQEEEARSAPLDRSRVPRLLVDLHVSAHKLVGKPEMSTSSCVLEDVHANDTNGSVGHPANTCKLFN